MESLQKLVPYYQELLQQWYQLTLHNQEYAICLAVSVWLITAIFYSIRIGFLKRSNAQLLKVNNETQTSLDEAKQQLDALQLQYAEANERMQQAVEKAETESQRLHASNRQLATSLSSMVDCFELNLHQLPAAESDNLLTEYEAVVTRVLERFRAEQQAKTQLQLSFHTETAKLAEKEMLVSSLQNRLDTQTQQLAKLELAVEQYEDAQRQLEADKQQLAREMEKRHAEAVRLLELEQQNLAAVQSQAPAVLTEKAPEPVQQPEIIQVAITEQPPEPEITSVPAQSAPKPQAPVAETSASIAKPLAESKSKADSGNKMKGLFGRAMDKIAKMDEKLGSPTRSRQEVAELPPSPTHEPQAAATPEPVVEDKKTSQDKGLNEKLSGLFGSLKKSPAKQAEPAKADIDPAPVAEAKATAAAKKPAALAGLFGKLKSKT